MNRRLILNVMIVAMFTFYLIFSIVYNRLLNKHEAEPPMIDATHWEKPFLVPSPWHLKRFELPTVTFQLDENGSWSSSDPAIDVQRINNFVNSWQNLGATNISAYQNLPLEGKTILIFIEEDSQPLVFRVTETAEALNFYRMIDAQVFSFPIISKSQLLPEMQLSKSP